MCQHSVQLLFRDSKPFSVCTVHYQDDELQTRQILKLTMLSKAQVTVSSVKMLYSMKRALHLKTGLWGLSCKSLLASTCTWECVWACMLHRVHWSGTAFRSSPHHLDLSHTNCYDWMAVKSFQSGLFVRWSTLTSGYAARKHTTAGLWMDKVHSIHQCDSTQWCIRLQ